MIKCVCDMCGRTIKGEPKHIDVDLYNERNDISGIYDDHVKLEFDLCEEHYASLRKMIIDARGTAKVTVNHYR